LWILFKKPVYATLLLEKKYQLSIIMNKKYYYAAVFNSDMREWVKMEEASFCNFD